LINYGNHENAHTTKVEGILQYLEQINRTEGFTEEIVLIVDGFDVWFQLRPDVLLKRFYAMNAAADARAERLYGEKLVKKYDIRQTVVFGPDKICWPVDYSRPACWAVPESTVPRSAFGPTHDTQDRSLNDARWLNSGTVMGAVDDMKEVFRATLDAIQSNYITDSDQFYFANIFGMQELARLKRVPKLLRAAKQQVFDDAEDVSGGVRSEPRLGRGVKTEYHIGIDYESTLFQTLAFWKQHLAWVVADSSKLPGGSRSLVNSSYDIRLPEDIQQSVSPFEPFKYDDDGQEQSQPSWSNVPLNYNTITRKFPVVLHVTGSPHEKDFRQYWWQKIWFQQQGEKLRLANLRLDQRQISTERIAGMLWHNAEGGEDAEEIASGGKGGVWTDRRGWLGWKRLCKDAEEELYFVPGEDVFHPPMVIATPEPEPSPVPGLIGWAPFNWLPSRLGRETEG
jgi:hypothetical protein